MAKGPFCFDSPRGPLMTMLAFRPNSPAWVADSSQWLLLIIKFLLHTKPGRGNYQANIYHGPLAVHSQLAGRCPWQPLRIAPLPFSNWSCRRRRLLLAWLMVTFL